MKLKLIYLFILLNVSCPAFSQNDTTYLNKEWSITTKDKALYWGKQCPDSGHCITYYMSGEISGDFEMLEGKRHGINLFYYKNGQVSNKITFNRGQLAGEYFSWYPNGKPQEEGVHFGEYLIHNFWDSLGTQLIKNGTGSYIYYDHPSLILKARGKFIDGRKEDFWIYNHYNGQLKESGHYLSNLKDGEWKVWDENGKLQYKEIYKKGILQNGVNYHTENDSLTYHEVFSSAYYPLGMDELAKKLTKRLRKIYFKTNRRYKRKTSVLTFIVVVEKDGSLSNVKPLKTIHPKLDVEVVKFLQTTSPWIPAYNRGEPEKMTLYVSFFLTRKSILKSLF